MTEQTVEKKKKVISQISRLKTRLTAYNELDIREDGRIYYKGERVNTHAGVDGKPVFSLEGERYTLHKVVAEKFCVRPFDCDIITFINGDVADCYYKNLKWTTRRDVILEINLKKGIKRGASKRANGRWQATMTYRGGGKSRYIGLYDTEAEAQAAYYETYVGIVGSAPW